MGLLRQGLAGRLGYPRLGCTWLGCTLLGCTPELEHDLARIDEPRVLAIEAVPAEAVPGSPVQLRALYVDGDGPVGDTALAWSWCTARRPLAELGPLARECLAEGDADAHADVLTPIGTGLAVDATLPLDGCRRFGPEPPPAEMGQPGGRPVDPDATGGYDQPLVVQAPAASPRTTLFGLRITCGPGNATQRQAAELRRRYQANVAPAIVAVEAEVDGHAPRVVEPQAPLVVAPGASVTWRARFAACPTSPECGDGLCTLDEDAERCAADCNAAPPGCGGAETYLRFDPLALHLATSRESLAVAWYGTDGRFDDPQTGAAINDDARIIDNGWTAPDEPGEVVLWMVARDDRGGTSWVERRVSVDD